MLPLVVVVVVVVLLEEEEEEEEGFPMTGTSVAKAKKILQLCVCVSWGICSDSSVPVGNNEMTM